MGLAAIASSITRPADRDGADTDTSTTGATSDPGTRPAAAPSPGAAPRDPTTVRFSAGGKRELRTLERGRPATALVSVEVPGQVEIPSLGLTQPADPLTPARFDLLVSDEGAHRILMRPADADAEASPVGTLKVVGER